MGRTLQKLAGEPKNSDTVFPTLGSNTRSGTVSLRHRGRMDHDPILFDFEEVSHNWRSFLFLGLMFVLFGIADLAALWLPKLSWLLTPGALLIIGGIMEVLAAKWGRHSSGLFLRVFVGISHIFVGFLLVKYPGASPTALTMLVAWLILTSGLLRTAVGALLRYPAWIWAILEGVAAVALGVAIWSQWSASSSWGIRVLVGAALICRGWAWMTFAVGVRPAGVEDSLFGYARNFW